MENSGQSQVISSAASNASTNNAGTQIVKENYSRLEINPKYCYTQSRVEYIMSKEYQEVEGKQLEELLYYMPRWSWD